MDLGTGGGSCAKLALQASDGPDGKPITVRVPIEMKCSLHGRIPINVSIGMLPAYGRKSVSDNATFRELAER